ncbi:MAG: gene transfer agent family protein [Nitratireductor sp.]|nr:gene transfer agent family protein [Nitratireductor sp.]
MANRHRGEIAAELDGRQWTLCLTLGALAELEDHFNVPSLTGLAEAFAGQPLSSSDLIAILAAGLKGGGHDLTREDVAEMRHAGGPEGFVRIVADLLQATFGAAGGGADAAAAG